MPLTGPQVMLRAHAVARHGCLTWPPLSLVTDLLARRAATTAGTRPAPARHGENRQLACHQGCSANDSKETGHDEYGPRERAA
ncbi:MULTISPECIES: hypothetical protein [Streptomyces]|uniref:Uncharacterized protein n=2 Tax=Streptomyces TaxID=1883 RepID=A0A100Y6L9_9ACTN|nr:MULTISPECIES: hypothetical protein [Streptomyces]KUH38614.1 hypothetical protein ATE80_12145 [Streptomyces kanasensis]UUS33904.1 hypothetical protein NRO40_25795 [Streptomyces changanensis]